MTKFNKRVFWAYFITAWTVRILFSIVSPTDYSFLDFLITADIHFAMGIFLGVMLK